MSGSLRYQRFSTESVPPTERFDNWRTWYSTAVECPMELTPVEGTPADFRSAAEVLHAGDVSVMELRSAAAEGTCTAESSEPGNLLRVALFCEAAGMSGSWHGQESAPCTGWANVSAWTAGWWHAPAGFHVIQVNVPRRQLGMSDAAIDRITERQIPDRWPVLDALVGPMLRGMVGRLESLADTATADLEVVLRSAVTMLCRSLDNEHLDGTDLAPARRRLAYRYIDTHLADPNLSPDTVAAALHMSRRSLYELLSDGDGVAGTIRRRRLARAREILLDPAQRHRSIAEVARSVGLPNPTHFSRIFRAYYGHTARDARAGST